MAVSLGGIGPDRSRVRSGCFNPGLLTEACFKPLQVKHSGRFGLFLREICSPVLLVHSLLLTATIHPQDDHSQSLIRMVGSL